MYWAPESQEPIGLESTSSTIRGWRVDAGADVGADLESGLEVLAGERDGVDDCDVGHVCLSFFLVEPLVLAQLIMRELPPEVVITRR